MNFEAYLVSKKIDSEAFKQAEQNVWASWQAEFEQLHPNSFTVQKLYLINPMRRKYPVIVEVKSQDQPSTPNVMAMIAQPETGSPKLETSDNEQITSNLEPGTSKPKVPRPVFKQPKPKIN